MTTVHTLIGAGNPAPALVSVPFRGGFIEAAQLEGEVFVPLRPLCDALGVSLEGQLAKLKRKPWATLKMIFTVADDGKARQLAAVDLRSLPLWLATIEPSRVKPEARAALVMYQREAADVLYRHFLAPPAPIKVPTVPGTIEATRIEGLEARVRKLEGEPLAAGMALRERGVPAPTPAPQLSGVHRELIGHAQELLEELDETRWHAQQLASDLEAIAAHGTAFLAGAQETLAALQSALHLAEGSGCALSANLSGEAITAPPGRHLATLARLWAATGPDRAELAAIDARNAAEAFASSSP
jgi:hypothetical protein